MKEKTTAIEETAIILNSIQNCHPSREDDIKAVLCIEALARRIDDLAEKIDTLESKIYETNE